MSRIALVNTNEIKPPVAPIALDYLAGALAAAGCETDIIDLNFAGDPLDELTRYFDANSPLVTGITFRNSDDCFWPSGASFVPRLVEILGAVRGLTDSPVVLGGAGFSVFPQAILDSCGCEFGIQGDGEDAFVSFVKAVERGSGLEDVPGLVRRTAGTGAGRCSCNPPHRPAPLTLATSRNHVDNARYLREGGQGNVETKRGCDRACVYCADRLTKGRTVRERPPAEVADEVAALLKQGVDVLHLCDSEFNIPLRHALDVCRELVGRGLGRRVRWYTYASIVPFPDELARAMREAGCVGVNFGADSANAQMLATYGRRYRKEDIAEAVGLCKRRGLRVMIDLLLGGPGETESSVRETVAFMKEISPDCVGAALGVRVYPGTPFARRVIGEGPLPSNPNLRRFATDPVNLAESASGDISASLLPPLFYISESLGQNPARLVRDIIAGDERFFEPVEEQSLENYNYNENQPLVQAIKDGARGAYWDILRKMRNSVA